MTYINPFEGAETVHITRAVVYYNANSFRASSTVYSYSINGGSAIEYGTSLGDLRDLIRRKARGAKVTTDW